MAWNDALVTNGGVKLLQRAMAGEVFYLDYAAGGTGTVQASALMAQTELAAKKQNFPIVKVSLLPSGQKLSIQINSIGLESGYPMQQIGIWAHIGNDDPVLFAILQDQAGIAIPSQTDMPDFTMTFYAVIAVSGDVKFNLKVDTSTLQKIILVPGIIKGDGNGNFETAVPGEDYGLPMVKGNAAPTEETEGTVGQHFIVTQTGKEYVCLGKDGEDYIWTVAGVTNTDEILYKGRPLSEALAAGLGSAADLILMGPASMIDRLPVGGLLLITDEADPEDYAVTLDDLLAEGYKAANGQSDNLGTILTVGRADVLDLRADITGTLFTEETLPTLVTAIRGVCAAAVANGAYVEDGVIDLSWRQVEYYIIHGVLVSHAEACQETWIWARDPSSEMLALRQAVSDITATVGNMNAVLDEVLEGEGDNGEGQEQEE